jgi:outer membrane lipoprotein-sorting protein
MRSMRAECGGACLFLSLFVLLTTACTGMTSVDATGELERARRAWAGNWHAVWQIEWHDAPLRGPVVAEIWHSADGRLRVETLEAPVAALNGLIRADDGIQTWLYDARQRQTLYGTRAQLRIPLVDDLLDAMEWTLVQQFHARVTAANDWAIESGAAVALELTTDTGESVTLWVNRETGLPAALVLHSSPWGQARCVTRTLDRRAHIDDALFTYDLIPEP